MAAMIRVESSFNPYAIGVVGGRLERQPMNKAEAVATAEALAKAGYNFSLGVAQVNRHNLARFNLTYETAFDPCESVRAGGSILKECYDRAKATFQEEQRALQAAFSCYYSGNFSTGFKQDFAGQPSYVQKVLNSAALPTGDVPKVQAIPVIRTGSTKAGAKPAAPAETSGTTSTDRTVVFSVGQDKEAGASVMVFR
jgi:type IV secretion system protein VirB1